jgi:iron complex outermembrane recepter protein
MLKSMTMRSTLAAVAYAIAFSAHAVADPKQVNIPAGDLTPALEMLEKQAAVELLFQPDQLKSFHTHGVTGIYEPKDAVRILLKGTPLELRTDPTGAMVIALPRTAVSRVQANSAGESGEPGDSRSGFRLAQATQGGNQTNLAVTNSSGAPSSTSNTENNGPVTLEEVIVTAQKRAERLQDVPISMSVLDGNALDKSDFSGVTESLNTVPGVSAFASQTQFGGTTLSIRGVSTSTGYLGGASTVAYYVDSVPFGQIRSAVVPDTNIYDLQQIEVLRGPQGTLYGANALNGVVRILTNDPDLNNFDFKARGVGSTTEYGGENYSGDLAVNVPIVDGALAARVTLGDDHESGWINGPVGTHLNSGELENARFKISAKPTDALSVELSAWHSQSSYDFPSASLSDRQSLAAHPEPMYSQFNALGTKLIYDFSYFSLASMTSYIDSQNTGTFDATPLGNPVVLTTSLPSRVISEEVNLTSKLEGPWRWSVGTMYRDDRDQTDLSLISYPSLATSTFAAFHDTSKSEAVYGELGRRFLSDEFQWTLGVRYFRDDEGTQANGPLAYANYPLNPFRATASATTPRAVLSWFPSKELTAYISYSQGFRSGELQNELVGVLVPNFPAARPDKLTNYEVGAKGDFFDGRVSYDADVFYMRWQDVQQQLDVAIPPAEGGGDAIVVVNAGSASGEGVEFSVKARVVDGLTLGADLGWNNLHFDSTIFSGGAVLSPEGTRPDQSPEYTGGVSAQYTFPLGVGGLKGSFSASGNYTSPLITNYLTGGQVEANSLLLTRGAFTVEFPSHWTASLFVDNANNYSGTQVANSIQTPGGQQFDPRLRPRTYGIKFDYHLR